MTRAILAMAEDHVGAIRESRITYGVPRIPPPDRAIGVSETGNRAATEIVHETGELRGGVIGIGGHGPIGEGHARAPGQRIIYEGRTHGWRARQRQPRRPSKVAIPYKNSPVQIIKITCLTPCPVSNWGRFRLTPYRPPYTES